MHDLTKISSFRFSAPKFTRQVIFLALNIFLDIDIFCGLQNLPKNFFKESKCFSCLIKFYGFLDFPNWHYEAAVLVLLDWPAWRQENWSLLWKAASTGPNARSWFSIWSKVHLLTWLLSYTSILTAQMAAKKLFLCSSASLCRYLLLSLASHSDC